MRRPLLATLVALVVAIPSMAGAATAPTISITSPANGASFSRSVFETIIVTGTASFDAPVPASRTFYLRRDACGGSAPANTRLSTTSGTDGGDGCGNLISGAVAGTENYPAENGLPLTLDTTKTGKVSVVLSSWSGVTGAGTQVVTATLTGRVGNQNKTLGSGTHSMNVVGVDAYTADITFPITNPGGPITDLNLALTVGGGFQHGHVNLNGASFVELPILDTGTVEVSSDSASFAASKTLVAQLGANGNWTAEILTPAAGASRKIYARAKQGSLTTNATPVSIIVTA